MEIDIFQLPGILRRRWVYPAAASVTCGVLALGFVLHQTPLYHATVELIIDPAGLQNPTSQTAGVQPSGQGQATTDSQIYVMQSTEVISSVVDKLHLQDDNWLAPGVAGGLVTRLLGGGHALSQDERKQEAIAALRDDIKVLRADQSLVFQITAKHPSSVKAADIANATAESYLGQIDESRSGTALRASMTLQAQADELRQRLQKAQNEVENFKAEHGLFSTVTKGLVADQEIETLSQQIAAASTKVDAQKTIYDQATKLSMADIEAGSIPEALQSSALVSLRTRYAQLLDTEAQLAANLGENHPQLKAARSQTASMRASINAELERVRASLKNNYQRAKADLDALQSRYKELTKTTGESGDARTRLTQLESNAQALKELYQSYLSKAEDLSGKQSLDPGASRIISPALPPVKASGAPKGLTVIAGLLFGLMLGAGLAVLRELLGAFKPVKLQKIHDESGIPVVARIAAPKAIKGGGIFTRLSRKRAESHEDERRAGVGRIADIIRSAFADENGTQVNILFYPASETVGALLPLKEVAEMLAEGGASVHYSDGNEAAVARPLMVRKGPRVAFAAKMQPDENAWGHGRLQFVAAGVTVPLLSVRRIADGFHLADAGGLIARDMRAELLDGADAIFAVASSRTPKSDLHQLKESLSPWSDRLLGLIVIEA